MSFVSFFSEVHMLAKPMDISLRSRFHAFTTLVPALALSLFLLPVLTAFAQGQSQDQSQAQPPDSSQNNGKPKQEVPAEAGGPTDSVGPYAIPKKNPDAATPPPPPPPTAPKVEGMPDYSIKVNVPLVNVDVMVTTKGGGQFVPGLKKDNFRVFEDGAQQQITNFGVSQAPVTAVLLIEFANNNYTANFLVQALKGSYAFANTLKKDDWAAVTYFDMLPHILVDFTQDKRAIYGALNELRIPGFSESNLFDALYDTLDRIDRVEGKKYIILVASGLDTFSKIRLDTILKKVKNTKDVTIFPISVGFAVREWYEAHGRAAPHGALGTPLSQIDYVQADNQMRTFASMTGGRAYFPRFDAEMPEIFADISSDIRNQYSISYHPTNNKLDGTYRKLKVQVVAPDGGPLKVRDQKGKDVKIDVVAREGYTAKHTVD
jgi:VWFA-related protein